MNLIAYDAAYSMYPTATFNKKTSLAFKASTPAELRAHAKYRQRGWTILDNVWSSDNADLDFFFVNAIRYVGDSMSWTIPFDTSGLQLRNCLSQCSRRFTWDAVRYNSWVLSPAAGSGRVFPDFKVVRSSVLRYTYVAATLAILRGLVRPANKYAIKRWKCTVHDGVPWDYTTWTW